MIYFDKKSLFVCPINTLELDDFYYKNTLWNIFQ